LLVRGNDVNIRRNASQLLPGAGLCGVRIANPPDAATMDCPKICPFIRPDTAHFCSFTCVRKEDCDNRSPLTSFADPMTHTCSPCVVPGCSTCGATKYECLKCNEYLVLSEDGACVSPFRTAWTVAYYVVGMVLALIVLYVVCVALRPMVNPLVLQRAEEFRYFSKLSYRSGGMEKSYPLSTNLCTENVAGTGILLHFNWQLAVIIWACIVTFALYLLSWIPPSVPDATHPNNGNVLEACAAAGSSQIAKEVKRADTLYLYVISGIYVLSTVGSLFLFVRHRRLTRQCIDSNKLRHYAMAAEGFPPCSGAQGMEEHYKGFFELELPDADIIGVSIAWDVRNSDLQLDSQVELELDILDRQRDERHDLSLDLKDVESGQRETCLDPQKCCHCVDDAILSAVAPDFDGCLEGEDLVKKLENITSTGTVFVVFKTRKQRNAAVEKNLEYVGSAISLSKVHHEPETMLWENRHPRSKKSHITEIAVKLIGCSIGLFVAVTLWAVFVYHPISSYLLSWTSVPGVERMHWWDETVQAALLSLPIMISNQILYLVCDLLSTWIRFQSTGSKQLTYVVMYTCFVCYQTVLDIWIVIQTAYGHQTEATWKLAAASGVLGSKAIAQNPSIRETLYVEMVAYLYPGTLLLPYLLEPVGIGIGQYLFCKWIIGSRDHIGIQAAENLLLALPYDLSRYGDILISSICCILLCFIASPDVYWVFFYLLVMLVFCYVWDHYRVLRLCPRFFEDDNRLDDAVIMMLSGPCALLAAAVVFRSYGAHEELAGSHMTRENAPIWCFFAFFIHLAFHLSAFCLIIARVSVNLTDEEGQHSDKDLSYEDAAGDTAFNWFNTNYVHCLRSKCIHKDSPVWCIPAKAGREYLIKREPKLGLFFEVHGHDKCRDQEAMSRMFGKAWKRGQNASRAAALRAAEVAHTVKDASEAAASRAAEVFHHAKTDIPAPSEEEKNDAAARGKSEAW